MFNNIPCTELSNHLDIVIYKYQIFQIKDIIIESDGKSIDCDNPFFNVRQDKGKEITFTECVFCTFYKTKQDAQKRQALDIHRILNNSFKANSNREKSMVDYFRKFIDERDLDFFISSVTNHQLYEDEYYKLLSLIAQDFPEKLI